MAIAISATPDVLFLRLQFQDVKGEQVIKVWQLDGAVDDGDLETALGHLDTLTNAGVVKGSLSSERAITGWAAATNALQNSVGTLMALTFTKEHPLNPAKIVQKAVIIPAPVDALQDTASNLPVSGNTDLNALITFLDDALTYLGVDGNYYGGSFDYDQSESGFGSVNREWDGL